MTVRQAILAALCFLLVTLAGAEGAQAQAQLARPGERHIAIALVAETDTPAAGGGVELAFVSRPQPGWHGYWQNPGDAGVPTTLKWTLPGGVTAGPLRYPVPERLLIAGLMNYVYEGPFVQFVRLDVPAGLAAGTRLPVAVTIDYLVCTREVCVPEQATLRTQLTVGDGAVSTERRAQFDGWRRALPKPLGSTATFAAVDGRFRLAVPFPADASAGDAYFYPLTDRAIDHAAPQRVTRDGDRLVIETKAGSGSLSEVAGVLSTAGQGFTLRAVPGAVAAAAVSPDPGWASAALWAFLAAIAGGLILNVMPCVFPILSLKALSLAKSGESAAQARREALAYTAGVVAVCLALGGTLLALRAGGAAVGWAFQLTSPPVLVVLLLLMTGIAFNLAGLFELPAPAFANRLAARGTGGAFATGALAAVVATPCSGPFMGAALGAALVLPWWAGLAVFGGLGLGIALPFLAIGFVPALRRALPRPGAWMATFRRVLAVPMFATALALAWLVGRIAGVDAMGFALLVAGGFAILLWALGRRAGQGGPESAALAAALLVVAIGGAVFVERFRVAPGPATAVAGHEPFSEARLAALRGEGRPVFAYFTADWCLSCKVNERIAIDTDATRAAFARANVATLVGDWTGGDPALGRFIERNGRAGVPLYLYYPNGAAAPTVLPQVLTPSTLATLTTGD